MVQRLMSRDEGKFDFSCHDHFKGCPSVPKYGCFSAFFFVNISFKQVFQTRLSSYQVNKIQQF